MDNNEQHPIVSILTLLIMYSLLVEYIALLCPFTNSIGIRAWISNCIQVLTADKSMIPYLNLVALSMFKCNSSWWLIGILQFL